MARPKGSTARAKGDGIWDLRDLVAKSKKAYGGVCPLCGRTAKGTLVLNGEGPSMTELVTRPGATSRALGQEITMRGWACRKCAKIGGRGRTLVQREEEARNREKDIREAMKELAEWERAGKEFFGGSDLGSS